MHIYKIDIVEKNTYSLLRNYEMVIYWSQDDNSFIVEVLEFHAA